MPKEKFSSGIDLINVPLDNLVLQSLAADPSALEAKIYFNSTTKKIRVHNGTAWEDAGAAAAGDVTGPSSSIDNELAVFNGTTGKIIKRSALTGLLKLTSGVTSVATPGTDYTTPGSTETFTNKTFNANGTGNSLSNVEVADLAPAAINSNTSLTGATNDQLPTALAVKTFVEALLNANDALVLKGGIDASTNPNYPAADAGHVYRITVAGKIGGASGIDVQIGDTINCITDGSAAGNQATVGANWIILQANVDRATTTTLGLTQYATAAEAEAGSDATKAVTPLALAGFPVKKTFTIGNGSATSFALTHNLGTQDVQVTARKVSTNELWNVNTIADTTNQITVYFAVAPTSNEFVITVIG